MKKTSLLYLLIITGILKQTDGKDKTLKVVQYSLKSLKVEHKRLLKLISTLSTSRKILRLMHWNEPLSQLWQSPDFSQLTSLESLQLLDSNQRLSLVNSVFSILNDIFDDICILVKLDILPGELFNYNTFDRMSVYLWYCTIFLDLHLDYFKPAIDAVEATTSTGGKPDIEISSVVAHAKTTWSVYKWTSFVKLLADLGFCTYDLIQVDGSRAQAVFGLLSAVLGTYKLYLKQLKQLQPKSE